MKSTFKINCAKLKLLAAILVLFLLLALTPAPFTYAADYNFTSEHFIYHTSLQGDVTPSRVSVENFNLFMKRLDMQYEVLRDLTGTGIRGGKVTLTFDTGGPGLQWVTPGQPEVIYVNNNPGLLNAVEEHGAARWRFEGTSHEIGHLFGMPNGPVLPWKSFDIEGWAEMLACIASHVNIAKHGGFYMSGANQRPEQWATTLPLGTTGVVREFVNPLFTSDRRPTTSSWTEESFERGWNILSQVFRSYHNGYIPRYSYSGGTERQRFRLDFIDRCRFFAVDDPNTEAEPGDLYVNLGLYNLLVDEVTRTPIDGGGIIPSPTPTPSPGDSTPSPTPSPGTSSPTPTPTPSAAPADCSDNCINYSPTADIIVTSDDTPKINLSNETLDLAGFAASEFSVDGGGKWKAVKADTFGDKKFAKLLNKGMALHLKDAGGSTVTFPVINPRPKPKLAANYEIAASGGAFGQWVLAEKNSSAAVKSNIQIGIAGLNDKGKPGKAVDTNGWGKFQADGGICVKPIGDKNGKPAVVKTTYFYRTAPSDVDGFTPGGKPKKIKATSQLKPTKYKLKDGKIKVKKGTIVNGAAPLADKAEIDFVAGMQVWMAATAKKAASAKQTVG
ncbi:MAG: hypothetical protein FWH04_01985 [Oscillospiraceae bacterium]|nr:hypothetical protein [Oscillospiraceae bacterium]